MLPLTLERNSRATIFLAILTLVGYIVLSYNDTFASMINVWKASSTFLHGFIILPMAAYIIWQKRDALRIEDAEWSWAGYGLLLASVCFWLLAKTAHAEVGEHLALIAMICTSIWSVLGTRIAKEIRFPLVFAFFAVPFGEFLIPPLMSWTAGFTVWALSITGIPVYLEGFFFALPSGNFEVVEACSGINYLVVTAVLAIYFAYQNYSALKTQIVFVLCAIAAIIVANGVRAYLVVLMAHFSGMKYGTGQDHIYFGVVVFVLVISMTFWVGARVNEEPAKISKANIAENRGGGMVRSRRWWSMIPSVIAVLFVVGLGPLAQRMAHARSVGIAMQSHLPHGTASWTGPAPVQLAYRPDFRSGQALAGRYSVGGGAVEVHAIVFAEQNQGHELIRWDNRLFDSDLWRPVQRPDTDSIRLGDGRQLQVTSMVVTDGRQDLLLWYWYDVGGWRTTNRIAAKIYHAVQGVAARDSSDALLVLSTPVSEPGSRQDSARLGTFLSEHLDRLSSCLRMTDTICFTEDL